MAFDLLIENGLVVDGTGGKPFKGNVAVQDGKIAGVGDVKGSATRVLDVGGLAVTPGFWDAHTHYDAQLLWDPVASSSSWHGVTSVIMGNCGFTLAPCTPQDQGYLVRMLARVEGMSEEVLARTLPWTWGSYGDYLQALKPALGINAGTLAGHTTIRRFVMGAEASERKSTDTELARMKQVLEESIKAGAFGLSTSRVVTHADGDGRPVPSRVAELSECFELATVLRDMRAGYLQFAVGSDFNKYSPEGRQRLTEMARMSGRPVCINSVVESKQNPNGWRDVLDWMAKLREEGHIVFAMGNVHTTDFVFDLKFTNVFDRFALWQKVLLDPAEKKMTTFKDASLRARLKREIEEFDDPFFRQNPFTWDRIVLTKTHAEDMKRFVGKNMMEIGKALGKHPVDAMFDITVTDRIETTFKELNVRSTDEAATEAIFKAPHMLVEQSDAGAHTITEIHTGFPTHFLAHWVREKRAVTLQEAVWRLTGLPAREVGVTDRGTLCEGQAADVVVLDPQTVGTSDPEFVDDLPGGGRRLIQRPQGVEYVVVNGQVTLEHGKYTGARAGQVLRRGS